MTTRTATTSSVWDRLDAGAKDLYQTRRWADLDCAMQDGEPVALEVELADRTVLVPTIARPLGSSTRQLTSAYGYPGIVGEDLGADVTVVPSSDAAAFVRGLAIAARDVGAAAVFLRLHPLLDADFPDVHGPDAATVEHGPTAAIDLRDGLEAAWASMRPRLRSYVRAFDDGPFTCTVDRWDEDFAAFRSAYADSMARRGASPLYRLDDEYWQRLREMSERDLHLLSVRDQTGEFAAGAVITAFDGQAGYHLGATSSAHLDHHLLELLLWRAAELVAPTARALHLGGGVGTARDGLYQLKRGMGRLALRYRTLRVVADRSACAAAVRPQPVDPAASRFPPAP